MPLPQPTSGEGKKDFIERCMKMMVKEMDGTDQAIAVCMKQWKGMRASAQYQRFTAKFEAAVFYESTTPLLPDPSAMSGEKKFVTGEPVVHRKLSGYAATFNCLSEDRGGYCFTVAPGSFVKSIGTDDIVALFNHEADHVLGRTSNGTLRLAEDDRGLAIEMDLPDTQFGRDIYTLIERGDIKQMSFGGTIVNEVEHRDSELSVIAIHEFKLMDVSPVTFPAFEEDRTAIGIAASSMSDVACDAEAAKGCPTRLYAAKKRLLEL